MKKCRNTKRSRNSRLLPEIPNDAWRMIVEKATCSEELFKSINDHGTNGEDPTACKREVELLRCIGLLSLVNKFFRKTLCSNQMAATWSVAIRQFRMDSVEKHGTKFKETIDQDIDFSNPLAIGEVSLQSGACMGIQRAMHHTCIMMHLACAVAYKGRNYSRCKGIVDLVRLMRNEGDRVYNDLGQLRWLDTENLDD